MKKIISLVLILVLSLSLGLIAFAEDDKDDADVEAVAIVREMPGAPVLSDIMEIRKIRNANGSSVDELVVSIPSDDLRLYTYDQIGELDEEDQKSFQKQIDEVMQLDEDLVKYLFWVEIPEEYEDLVGEQPDGSKNELDLYFTTEDEDADSTYIATVNDEDAEVDEDKDEGCFVLRLDQLGGVIIQITKNVKPAEENEIWEDRYIYDSPVRKVTERTKSSAMPAFDDDYYEIKLIIESNATTDEFGNDQLIVEVPRDDMYVTPIDQIDTLTEEEQKKFNDEYEKVKKIDDYIVQYFFYIDLAEQYRDLLGEQEDGSIQYLLLSFAAKKDTDYRVTSNSNEMEVQQSKDDSSKYYIKLSELGSVAIMYPEEQA